MHPLAHGLGLAFSRGPPRDALETVLDNRVQQVLKTWHLQGERVQPVALPAAFDAPNALVRDVGSICQGELSAHVRQALANSQVGTANRPRTWPVLQPCLVHVRLELVGKA